MFCFAMLRLTMARYMRRCQLMPLMLVAPRFPEAVASFQITPRLPLRHKIARRLATPCQCCYRCLRPAIRRLLIFRRRQRC